MAIEWAEPVEMRAHDAEVSLLAEIRQSFTLMGLLAAVSAGLVGLGLLAVRLLG